MGKKTTYDTYEESTIAANSQLVTELPTIPAGKVVRVLKFGGYDSLTADGLSGIISLQFENGAGGWKTLRAGGHGCFEFLINEDFVFPEPRKFRIVRVNKSKDPKEMFVWSNIVLL